MYNAVVMWCQLDTVKLVVLVRNANKLILVATSSLHSLCKLSHWTVQALRTHVV